MDTFCALSKVRNNAKWKAADTNNVIENPIENGFRVLKKRKPTANERRVVKRTCFLVICGSVNLSRKKEERGVFI